MKHPRLSNSWFIRYKFGKAKSVTPPELPSAPPEVSQISMQAMKVGEAESKRYRKGKTRTIFAGRRALAPAPVAQAGLKTTFG